MEHLRHFGLADDPFRNEPLQSLYLATPRHSDAMRRVERAVRQARGLSVLIGEAGAGKTMVVRQLLETLEEEVFEASVLVVLSESADTDWMLRRFALQLGAEEPAPDREALIAQIYDQLAIVREDGRHAVLIIDDAQALAATAALAELTSLLKLEYEDRRLLSLVLCGDATLDAAISGTAELAQRVDVKVRLEGLDEADAAEYIAQRLIGAAGTPSLVSPAALESLHAYGRGLPGRMNTLADNALFEAFLCGRSQLTPSDVERAFADLQPLAVASASDPGAAATPRSVKSSNDAISLATPMAPREIARPVEVASPIEELDREFEAVFESATLLETELYEGEPALDSALKSAPAELGQLPEGAATLTASGFEIPKEGPPKDADDEIEDLLVEITDER